MHCVTSALAHTAQPRGRAWCCGAALGPLPAVAPGGRFPCSPFPAWALWGWGWLGWAMGRRGLPTLTLSPLLPQPVWYQVRPLRQADLRQRLGAAGAGQRLPPRLLRLLLLQAAALHRRGVRLGGGEGAVPDPLRHHDREPQASGRKRYGAAVQPSARGHRCRGEVSGPVPLLLGACGEWDGPAQRLLLPWGARGCDGLALLVAELCAEGNAGHSPWSSSRRTAWPCCCMRQVRKPQGF